MADQNDDVFIRGRGVDYSDFTAFLVPDNKIIVPAGGDPSTSAGNAWGQTVAGIFTVGGVLAVFQVNDAVSNLTSGSKTIFIIVLVLALLCAVAAVVLAFSATWDPDFLGWRPSGRLNASIGSFIFSIVFVAAAAVIILTGQATPAEEAAEYFVRVGADDTVHCGPLATEDGVVSFLGKPLAAEDAILLAAAEGCPTQ